MKLEYVFTRCRIPQSKRNSNASRPRKNKPTNPMSETALPEILMALVLPVLIGSLIWVGFDAKRRGRKSSRIVLWCLITWPLGFLIWRSLRPPPPG